MALKTQTKKEKGVWNGNCEVKEPKELGETLNSEPHDSSLTARAVLTLFPQAHPTAGAHLWMNQSSEEQMVEKSRKTRPAGVRETQWAPTSSWHFYPFL